MQKISKCSFPWKIVDDFYIQSSQLQSYAQSAMRQSKANFQDSAYHHFPCNLDIFHFFWLGNSTEPVRMPFLGTKSFLQKNDWKIGSQIVFENLAGIFEGLTNRHLIWKHINGSLGFLKSLSNLSNLGQNYNDMQKTFYVTHLLHANIIASSVWLHVHFFFYYSWCCLLCRES